MIVTQHAGLVVSVAGQVKAKLRGADLDELIGTGNLALIGAVERFDPGRQVPFVKFAAIKIRQAMVDELRRSTWESQRVIRERRIIEATQDRVAAHDGRAATIEELVDRTGLDADRIRKVAGTIRNGPAVLSLDVEDDETLEAVAVDNDNAAQQLPVAEIRAVLAGAMSGLDEHHRLVLTLVYRSGESDSAIAKLLGCSPSRVSQLKTEAIAAFRDAVRTTAVSGEVLHRTILHG